MGATNYENLYIGKGTPSEAFRELVEDAREYEGHQEGYSGDIQTAYGFEMIDTKFQFSKKTFYDWVDKLQERMDKGDCYCYELTKHEVNRNKSKRWKGKKGVRGYYFFGLGRC
jgi:anthranilate/para-aminobenzoate synthase component I